MCSFKIKRICTNSFLVVRLVFRRSRVRSSGPAKHSFVKIGHEIFSTAIISLLLIQVGQLSVTCERMGTKYWLTVFKKVSRKVQEEPQAETTANPRHQEEEKK